MTIFEFFDNLQRCDTPQFNMMIIRRGSWISPVLARLTTIVATLPQEWSETRLTMVFMSALANAEIEGGVATARFDREHFTDLPSFDVVEVAFNKMVDARKVGCMNIVCPSLPTEVIHSRLCSRCDLVRYCGEKVSPPSLFSFTISILIAERLFAVSKRSLEMRYTPPQTFLRRRSLLERVIRCRLAAAMDRRLHLRTVSSSVQIESRRYRSCEGHRKHDVGPRDPPKCA
ncbi:hypothetical protein FIBSPDRAFT_64782 [Athelia psychrophila]|uniref:Uncharacterized protein n=1 Tax=Athelia psychrophila TaxID=1759441 RepID=A0A167SYI0_9AGAM|nr:hypothetical protein FIBSPDRAFT_64782 [Fibularhizoctonia sp. CBS 109695]